MNVLMIVGSPKQNHSTSEKIGDYLCRLLSSKGHQTDRINATIATLSDDGQNTLELKSKRADLILFAFPLYVDSLPAPLTNVCQILSKSIAGSGKKIVAICNSGFPEPIHNNMALDILKNFSRQTGLVWIGGVSVGSGAALASKKPMKLEEHGGMTMKLQRTLELLASIIDNGLTCQQNLETVAQPLPAWLYCMMGNFGWNSAAKRRGLTRKQLFHKPLLEVKL
jgi:NAD(P)H-dependent FMN reductase